MAEVRSDNDRQTQEKRNGTTAAVGPGENGLSQGNKTNVKTKNRAMASAVGKLIARHSPRAMFDYLLYPTMMRLASKVSWSFAVNLWVISRQAAVWRAKECASIGVNVHFRKAV
jgi:hypothetical protein